MAQKKIQPNLRTRLREACIKRGAVAFGIASVGSADALLKVKIGFPLRRWSEPLRKRMPEAESAIVFGLPSVDDSDELEVRKARDKWSYPGYLPLSIMAREVIQILRSEGHLAAHPSEFANHKSIAVLAGIGNYGRNSLIISPKHGPWLRLGIVVTDAVFQYDQPFEKDLCEKCVLCVQECPAKALEPYVVDPGRCLVGVGELDTTPKEFKPLLRKYQPHITPMARVMCTRCQMVCPYTTSERRKMVVSIPPARSGPRYSAKKRTG